MTSRNSKLYKIYSEFLPVCTADKTVKAICKYYGRQPYDRSKQLVSGFLPHWSEFNPRSISVGFVVDKSSNRTGFCPSGFPLHVAISPLLNFLIIRG